MPAQDHHSVGIIGGGAAGALTAIALGRMSAGPLVIFEPRADVGRGYAYSTRRSEHVLNVPAARLSADPESPDDFIAWRNNRIGPTGPDDFCPRADYGWYLGERVADLATHVEAIVEDVEITPDGVARSVIVTTGRQRWSVDHIVLATGYGLSPGHHLFAEVEHPLIVRDPYAPGATAALSGDRSIVVVGTGLTAIDVILALASEHPRQRIIAVSRRGRTPAIHDLAVEPVDVALNSTTTRSLLRELRTAVKAAEVDGIDWRAVLDGVRPHVPALWAALPLPERQRFLRVGRRMWDLHRHRVAPSIAARLDELIAAGRLEVRRGRPVLLDASDTSVTIDTGDGRPLEVAGVVLCTGAVYNEPLRSDPLLRRLIERGVAVADDTGLGPEVDPEGRLISPDGKVTNLSTVGPLRRAGAWESTAIPEIRRQAWRLAETIRYEHRSLASLP